jgi:hypothetical protein
VIVSRRVVSAGLLATGIALVSGNAFAGSYLNRAALLVNGGRREAEYLRAHFADKELARIVHQLAITRVETGGAMMVPKEVVQAHPHLLLVFENYERAADAAETSAAERFIVFLQHALDEERTFRAVLRNLGWELPNSPTSPG